MGTYFAIGLVFVGCCSNVVSLELLVRSVTNLDCHVDFIAYTFKQLSHIFGNFLLNE